MEQARLELIPTSPDELEAYERLVRYRRDYWLQYKQRHKRVYGALTPEEYAEIKALADANERSVWQEIWQQAKALSCTAVSALRGVQGRGRAALYRAAPIQRFDSCVGGKAPRARNAASACGGQRAGAAHGGADRGLHSSSGDRVMIIKSMARKTASFGQLVAYFGRGQSVRGAGVFARNLLADPRDTEAVEREFLANHDYLARRANGNALYHEIIVLDRETGLSAERENRILLDLAARYGELRAPDQLVFGWIHDDQSHRHIHLMISSNAVRSERRSRLTKARYAEIQREVETYLLERYPEAGSRRIYTRGTEYEHLRTRNREGELERRTRKPSRKRAIREALAQIFEEASDRSDLERRVEQAGLRFYTRGTQIGIEPVDEGRKLRLKTLGLDDQYRQCLERFERQNSAPPPVRDSADDLLKAREAELLRNRTVQERFADDHLRDFDGQR